MIKELRAADLQAYIYSAEYEQSPVLPISRHRALSHIANPRLQAEDVILLLAYNEENVLVGYLGVLPDEIFINGKHARGGWLSCMWVNPITRGQGIGGKLVAAALNAYDQRILVTEFTPAAKRLYDRAEAFVDLHQAVGLRGFLRFNTAKVLPRKKPLFQRLKPLLMLGDWLLNLPNDLRVKLKNYRPNLHWEYVNELDDELENFLIARQNNQVFRRGQAEINWMLMQPWILSGPDQDDYSRRYHFSAVDERFDFMLLRLYRRTGELAGLLMLSVRNQHMKVPFLYVEEDLLPEVAKLIFKHMQQMKLNMLSVFHPALVAHIRANQHPFFHLRDLRRHYIIAKEFADDITAQGEIVIQDGDADCAFT
ncbi:MAG: GNAT family N-acetyltransferase [Bacteroidota bacterium]